MYLALLKYLDLLEKAEVISKSQLRVAHQLRLPSKGDFMVNNKFIFEVGGKNKMFNINEQFGSACPSRATKD